MAQHIDEKTEATPAPTPSVPVSAAPDPTERQQIAAKNRRLRKLVERRRTTAHRIAGSTRFMAIVPIVGLFVAAIAMTVATLVSTVRVTVEVVQGHVTMQDMLVDYIEYADFFLLSIVLYIMSVGLYSLFIDDDIDLPPWLAVHTLDDLKEKLVSVIVVVMGVFFLGRLIHGAQSFDLLCMGVGIGAVILSLAYFVRHIMVAHKEKERE